MLVLSTLVACTNSEQDSAGSLDVSILVISFEELVEEADLVAHVTIGNKIGERNEPSPKSIFEITINQVYKGNEAKTNTQSTVYQLSWASEENHFTFTSSSEYILFMKETVGVDDSEYWILNEQAGQFKFIEDNILINSAYVYDELNSIAMDENEYSSLDSLNTDDLSEVVQQVFIKEIFISKIKTIKNNN